MGLEGKRRATSRIPRARNETLVHIQLWPAHPGREGIEPVREKAFRRADFRCEGKPFVALEAPAANEGE